MAKLQLMYDLERIRGLLREGQDVFEPHRDRAHFLEHLLAIGCEPGDERFRRLSDPDVTVQR
jgi:hypothetical protein